MIDQKTLAELTADNTSFSKEVPGLQLVWDTVCTGVIKQCPRKYQLQHVEGWFEKRVSVHLTFGLLMHSAIELYCKVKAKGEDHETGVRLAVRHCLEKAGEYAPAVVCQDCSHIAKGYTKEIMDSNSCLACGSENIRLHPEHWFQWLSDDSNKNRYTLVRTVVWYLDHYKESSEKTIIFSDGSPAVELWFRFELELISPDGTPYVLTGHIDRLTEFANSFWFQDLKSTKNTISSNFFDKFSPDNQISFYTAAGKIVFDKPIVGGIIDAAQVAVNFTKFQRGLIQRTPDQISEWLKDIEIWIKQAEGYARAGYWPMNDTACHQFGGCQFRGVCNKDPAIRLQKLKTQFERKIWDPLVERK